MITDRLVLCRTPVFLRALGLGMRPNAHIQRPIINLLASLPGRIFSTEELLEAVYGDDPEGGIVFAARAIYVSIYRLRRHGWTIVSHGRRGYSLKL